MWKNAQNYELYVVKEDWPNPSYLELEVKTLTKLRRLRGRLKRISRRNCFKGTVQSSCKCLLRSPEKCPCVPCLKTMKRNDIKWPKNNAIWMKRAA